MDVTLHSRQLLVQRLDSYQKSHLDLFLRVVTLLQDDVFPQLRRHASTGRARVYVVGFRMLC